MTYCTPCQPLNCLNNVAIRIAASMQTGCSEQKMLDGPTAEHKGLQSGNDVWPILGQSPGGSPVLGQGPVEFILYFCHNPKVASMYDNINKYFNPPVKNLSTQFFFTYLQEYIVTCLLLVDSSPLWLCLLIMSNLIRDHWSSSCNNGCHMEVTLHDYCISLLSPLDHNCHSVKVF